MHTSNITIDPDKLRSGVSGIMRVKNDAQFIEMCVESCINALDELIIVWNDCSDNSAEVIEKVRNKYPSKVKTYEYNHKVYSINLTKEEYEFIKSQPDNSPHLLCNYYNFALSHVTCQYAMKIDADQIYYTDKLKKWCDIYRGGRLKRSFKTYIGFAVWVYMKIVNRINNEKEVYSANYPTVKRNSFWRRMYEHFVQYKASCGSPVSLSGVDVIKLDKWFVSLGNKNSIINILPPYNGVGDHLIFKVTDNTYYRPDDCKFYNELRSDNYSLIEWFEHDGGREYPIGPCWFHVNAMRDNVYERVKKTVSLYPNSIMEISDFAQTNYNKIRPHMDQAMVVQYQDNLFHFIHQFFSCDIIDNLPIIQKISI